MVLEMASDTQVYVKGFSLVWIQALSEKSYLVKERNFSSIQVSLHLKWAIERFYFLHILVKCEFSSRYVITPLDVKNSNSLVLLLKEWHSAIFNINIII